jgi:uncharacterized protein
MSSVLRLVILAAAVTGLGTAAAAPAETVFPRATAVIEAGSRAVRLPVEVARTSEQQQLGLMHRRSLAPNAGMAFVFPRPTRGGFWMKNTLIPLSIAFYDARGRILRILDMEPCRADPCPIYDPSVTYRGALEVNRGAFRRLQIGRGDVVTLRPR